jgi:uncharacterized membrane protein YoaT (DUF817 family)
MYFDLYTCIYREREFVCVVVYVCMYTYIHTYVYICLGTTSQKVPIFMDFVNIDFDIFIVNVLGH